MLMGFNIASPWFKSMEHDCTVSTTRPSLWQLHEMGNNKILPIIFTVVESEIKEAWLFFLQNLKRHVIPQHGLCLILDKHKSIKSVYSRSGSGWMTQNLVHLFCIWHISQNYMRRYKINEKKTNYQYGWMSDFFLFILNITSFCIIHNIEIVCL